MKSYIDYYQANPLGTLSIIAACSYIFGVAIMTMWFYVPADYIPTPTMISKLENIQCTYPRCTRIVDDLITRYNLTTH